MAENVDYSKVKSDLISYLNSLGKDDGVVDSIVDLLEKIDAPRNPQRRIYCKFYTMALFRTYCGCDDDTEVMLAASGLLKGFEGISKDFEKCRIAYWKHANGYNNLLKKSWGEATQRKRLGEARIRITEYLADAIMSDFSDQNGKLNLTKKYEFPSILELPLPRESREECITWPFHPCESVSTEPSSTEPRPAEPSPVGSSPSNRRSNKILCYIVAVGVILIISLQILAANNGYARLELGLFRTVLDFRSDYARPAPIEQTEPASVSGNNVESSSKIVDDYILEHENEQEDDFNEKS